MFMIPIGDTSCGKSRLRQLSYQLKGEHSFVTLVASTQTLRISVWPIVVRMLNENHFFHLSNHYNHFQMQVQSVHRVSVVTIKCWAHTVKCHCFAQAWYNCARDAWKSIHIWPKQKHLRHRLKTVKHRHQTVIINCKKITMRTIYGLR